MTWADRSCCLASANSSRQHRPAVRLSWSSRSNANGQGTGSGFAGGRPQRPNLCCANQKSAPCPLSAQSDCRRGADRNSRVGPSRLCALLAHMQTSAFAAAHKWQTDQRAPAAIQRVDTAPAVADWKVRATDSKSGPSKASERSTIKSIRQKILRLILLIRTIRCPRNSFVVNQQTPLFNLKRRGLPNCSIQNLAYRCLCRKHRRPVMAVPSLRTRADVGLYTPRELGGEDGEGTKPEAVVRCGLPVLLSWGQLKSSPARQLSIASRMHRIEGYYVGMAPIPQFRIRGLNWLSACQNLDDEQHQTLDCDLPHRLPLLQCHLEH